MPSPPTGAEVALLVRRVRRPRQRAAVFSGGPQKCADGESNPDRLLTELRSVWKAGILTARRSAPTSRFPELSGASLRNSMRMHRCRLNIWVKPEKIPTKIPRRFFSVIAPSGAAAPTSLCYCLFSSGRATVLAPLWWTEESTMSLTCTTAPVRSDDRLGLV